MVQPVTPREGAEEPGHVGGGGSWVRIRASRGWPAPNLSEVWAHRELLLFLVWRDVKIRYKQTALGVAWAVIQPLFAMLVFSIFFSRLADPGPGGVPYSLFAFAGLLLWMFFANAITNSGNSVVANTNLVTKVYFPRLIIPLAPVLASLIDLAIGSAVLIGLMGYYRVAPGAGVLLCPVLVGLVVVLAMGVGSLLAGLNVKYRDIRHALPFVVQLWMFLTPIIYPPSLVPDQWRWLLALNPMTGFVQGIRASLFNERLAWGEIGIALVVTMVVLAAALLVFRRAERDFADTI